MGPNGSGKSTLANAIMGHPNLEVTEGQILFDGEDITEADPDERARAGLFMAFQYPVAIPGVTVAKYLRMVINAHREGRGEEAISLKDFRKTVEAAMELTQVPRSSPAATSTTASPAARRSAWRSSSSRSPSRRWPCSTRPTRAWTSTRSTPSPPASTRSPQGTDMGVLIITHYQRILHMVKPQFVHIMFEGRIVKEGGPELVTELEEKGYGWIRDEVAAAALMSPGGPHLRRVPDPRARGPGLPRHRGHLADRAARRWRRWTATTRPTAPRSTAASTRSPRRPPTPTRSRASRVAAFTNSTPRRDGLHAQRDRGDQPRRVRVGPRERRPGRPRGAHADGAPLEHRPVAAARLPAGLRAGAPTTACWTSTRSTSCSRRARSSSRSPTSPTCSGTINPIAEIVARAHAAGALVLVDGAQAVPSLPVDVAELDADFYAWTGHKAYGPTGIGVLHGRRELLEAMPPFLGGGHMIARVGDFESTWAEPPAQVRGGHDAGGRGDRPRRGRRLAARRSGMETVREHGRDVTALRARAAVRGRRA